MPDLGFLVTTTTNGTCTAYAVEGVMDKAITMLQFKLGGND
ncbi:hypothetical protein [Bartonella harrusi]|nr:hypothetical protein [Bartonella harrusi]